MRRVNALHRTTGRVLQYKAGIHPEPPGTGRGVMVALTIPRAAAEKIAVPGGLEPDDLHVTLVYLGDADELAITADDLRAALLDVAGRFDPVEGTITGVGRFNNTGPDGDAVWAPFDAPELPALQAAVLRAVHDAGGDPPIEHGYIPHVTLGYVDAGDPGIPVPMVPRTDVVIPNLTVWWAGTLTDLPLAGAEHGMLL